MIVDLVLLAVLILTAVSAYRRGFLQSLRGLVSYAGAFYASYRFTTPVADWTYETIVRPILIDKIKEAIFSGKATDDGYLWKEYILQGQSLFKKAADVAEYVVDQCLAGTIQPIVRSVVSIVLFVLASFVLSLVLRWIIRILTRNRPIRMTDSLAGLVVGVVQGVILVAILATALALYAQTSDTNALVNEVQDSRLVSLASETIIPTVNQFFSTQLRKLKI